MGTAVAVQHPRSRRTQDRCCGAGVSHKHEKFVCDLDAQHWLLCRLMIAQEQLREVSLYPVFRKVS